MLNHYKTLGLESTATATELKSAFRTLAKEYHPDRNAGRLAWAHAQMKRLLEANKVLSNPLLRASYDRRHAFVAERVNPTRAERLRRDSDHPSAQAEQILYDLLSGREGEAIAHYEKLLQARGGFELSHHLDLKDWVDCKFLIAEQFQQNGAYDRALALYEELYHSEDARRRYSQFIHEVRDRILRICCHDLAAGASPQHAAQYYLRALALHLPRDRRAFLHKKLAECHLDAGDLESARRHLAIAFELKRDLKGAGRICRRLGLVPPGNRRPAESIQAT